MSFIHVLRITQSETTRQYVKVQVHSSTWWHRFWRWAIQCKLFSGKDWQILVYLVCPIISFWIVCSRLRQSLANCILRKKETWRWLQLESRINTNVYMSYKRIMNQLWNQSGISWERSWVHKEQTMGRPIPTWKHHFLSSRFGNRANICVNIYSV